MASIDPSITAALIGVSTAALGLVSLILLQTAQQVRVNKVTIATLVAAMRNVTHPAGGGGRRADDPPVWDQLSDPLSDGTLAPQRANECGEECVAMAVAWVHRVPLAADAIRYLIAGARGNALTSGADLVKACKLCNVGGRTELVEAASFNRFIEWAAEGKLSIVLGDWVSATIPHWVLVTNASPNGVTVNDPWGGRHYNIALADFKRLYLGTVVWITSSPDPPATV